MARKGPVETEMGGFPKPGMKGQKGMYDRSPAPFDKGHDLGNGGIPLKFQESGPSKTPTPPAQTTGRDTRAPRAGTMQRAFGRTDE